MSDQMLRDWTAFEDDSEEALHELEGEAMEGHMSDGEALQQFECDY